MPSGTPVIRLPPMLTEPSLGRSRPASVRSSVVLPAPDGPTIETNSPGSTEKERSASA